MFHASPLVDGGDADGCHVGGLPSPRPRTPTERNGNLLLRRLGQPSSVLTSDRVRLPLDVVVGVPVLRLQVVLVTDSQRGGDQAICTAVADSDEIDRLGLR